MSKIFKITVTVDVYFYGDGFPKDYDLADAVKSEIWEHGNYDSDFTYINSPVGLPSGVLNSCPYGENGNEHTIKEWLKKNQH